MKDIKENQKGLKALADERPDVVKKMGYDPESFYGGGLAMLANGGSVDPDSAIDLFKMKSENNLRDFIGKNAISKILGDVLRGRDARDALEEGGINQILKESNIPLRKDGKEIIFDVNPEFSFYRNPMETGIRFERKLNEGGILKLAPGGPIFPTFKSIKNMFGFGDDKDKERKLDPKDEVMVTPDFKLSDDEKEKFAELAAQSYDKNLSEQYDKLASDITEYNFEYDKEGNLTNDPFKKSLTKGQKALAALEGLGALADIEMPEAVMVSRGGIGEAIVPTMPNVFRVGGMADGGIMEMANGGTMYADENLKKLEQLIDASPLKSKDKAIQKQIARMQMAQQFMPGTTQYIPTDAPYKAVYRPYFSEVTKEYAASRPGRPFSAAVAPPIERVNFNLGMRGDGSFNPPRRVSGVEYAADGMLIDGKFFPETDELVSGPGSETSDEIPAMLSDGEFVVNAKTVRGLGLQMGANPADLEEQTDIGAMVLEYLQDTLGPDGEAADNLVKSGLGSLVGVMS